MTWLWGWLGLQYARTAVLQYDCLEANIETKMLSNVQMWAWNWNKISNIFDSWINGRKDSPDSVTSVNANLYKGGYFWPSHVTLLLIIHAFWFFTGWWCPQNVCPQKIIFKNSSTGSWSSPKRSKRFIS